MLLSSLLLVAAAAAAASAPAPELTAARVQQAIDYGKASKKILAVVIWSPKKELCGVAMTTFMDIASTSQHEAKINKTLTEPEVPKSARRSRLVVNAVPLERKDKRVESVKAIVVLPAGASNSAGAIQPTSSEAKPAAGMKAEFPLSVIAAGNEIRVAYTGDQECVLKVNPDDFIQ